MTLKRFFERLSGSKGRSGSEERRYDNVQVINMADGTVIQGHDAVKAHFERERELSAKYGPNIIFQVGRINLQADSIEELVRGPLAEITVDDGFVSGTDTVADVKARLRPLLEETAKLNPAPDFSIDEADHFTLFFNDRPMQDDKLFYAEHFMLLPAWVQVHLHRCEFNEVLELAAKLREQA